MKRWKLDRLAKDSVDIYMEFWKDKLEGKRDFSRRMTFTNGRNGNEGYLFRAARKYALERYRRKIFIREEVEDSYYIIDIKECLKLPRYRRKDFRLI